MESKNEEETQQFYESYLQSSRLTKLKKLKNCEKVVEQENEESTEGIHKLKISSSNNKNTESKEIVETLIPELSGNFMRIDNQTHKVWLLKNDMPPSLCEKILHNSKGIKLRTYEFFKMNDLGEFETITEDAFKLETDLKNQLKIYQPVDLDKNIGKILIPNHLFEEYVEEANKILIGNNNQPKSMKVINKNLMKSQMDEWVQIMEKYKEIIPETFKNDPQNENKDDWKIDLMIPSLNFTLKIHKQPKIVEGIKKYAIRPIIQKNYRDFQRPIDNLLLRILSPIIKEEIDEFNILIDSEIGLIQEINKRNGNSPGWCKNLKSLQLDAEGMYNNIDHNNVLIALKIFLSEKENKLPNWLNKEEIMEIMEKYLKTLYYYSGKTLYKQTNGIPIGAAISPFLSQILIRESEKEIRTDSEIKFYKRYIDDVFILINKNNYENKKKEIIDKLNKSKLNFIVDPDQDNIFIGNHLEIYDNNLFILPQLSTITFSKMKLYKKKDRNIYIRNIIIKLYRTCNSKNYILEYIKDMLMWDLLPKNPIKRKIILQPPKEIWIHNKQLNRQLTTKKEESIDIYTDGSLKEEIKIKTINNGKIINKKLNLKGKDGNGFGIFSSDLKILNIIGKINKKSQEARKIKWSSTVCEKAAILTALLKLNKFLPSIRNKNLDFGLPKLIRIFSDSQSSLQSLKQKKTDQDIFSQKICNISQNIRNKGFILKFNKIKGHTNILGNELADLFADIASSWSRSKFKKFTTNGSFYSSVDYHNLKI